jgi:site-specific recombinase XerD
MERRKRTWRDADRRLVLLREALHLFLLDQEDRNHSPKTIRWYQDMLGRFVRFMGAGATTHDVTEAAVRSYQHDSRTSGRSRRWRRDATAAA